MKRIASLTAAILVLGCAGAFAQGAAGRPESFIGVVKTVSGASVTAERGTITGVFGIDPKTRVVAKGASTKTREKIAEGKPGLTVPDAVHVGDQVMIKFREVDGKMWASQIQVLVQSLQAAKR